MDTRLLRIFTAIASHGALPAASRDLHLSTSALSHGLKALESQLGVRLFDRTGKKLVLNQAGEQLLEGVQEPLAALERAASSLKGLARWGQGRLRVGAPETICQCLLPQVIAEVHREFPRVFLAVESGPSGTLLELLREHRIDLAITVDPPPSPDFELQPLFEDELLFAFSPEHPWAQGQALSRQEIARQPLLLPSRGGATSRLIYQYFADHGIEPTPFMEVRSIGAALALVRRNLGVAIAAPWVLGPELQAGLVKLRPLGNRRLSRPWRIGHRVQGRLTLAEEEFVKVCRRKAAELLLAKKSVAELSVPPPTRPAEDRAPVAHG